VQCPIICDHKWLPYFLEESLPLLDGTGLCQGPVLTVKCNASLAELDNTPWCEVLEGFFRELISVDTPIEAPGTYEIECGPTEGPLFIAIFYLAR
jgi:hypothetical protein